MNATIHDAPVRTRHWWFREWLTLNEDDPAAPWVEGLVGDTSEDKP